MSAAMKRKQHEKMEYNRIQSELNIPGAVWDTSQQKNRSHLSGIPYSYYDDEIVMLREHTVALIERQLAESDLPVKENGWVIKRRKQRRNHKSR